MTKRKIPNKPCVIIFVYYVEEVELCSHCNAPTNILMEGWIDNDYMLELQNRGINKEYASQLATASSIRHQQKKDGKPYHLRYLCKNCLIESSIKILNETSYKGIIDMMQQFNTNMRYIIFDKNKDDEITSPTLLVADFKDIHAFLEAYDELEEQF